VDFHENFGREIDSHSQFNVGQNLYQYSYHFVWYCSAVYATN